MKMLIVDDHGDLAVMNRNLAIKKLLEKAPVMCASCGHRPADVQGLGGPVCVYCDDQIDL